ncbi:MAG: zinc ABC transporter substrate-binding protein, partial [Myxococcales bacterium]|nr:zinc ABC transporter substrate-binding protein [Myxococcales bacterium]
MLFILVALLALGLTPRAAEAKLDVVVTIPSLETIVHAVGGEWVTTHAIARPTQDPHFVDAKPSEMLRLAKADLLVLSGLSLEQAWLTPLLQGSRNPKVQSGAPGYVDCSSFVKVLDVPVTIDRSQGDIHPGGDPHYLMHPRNAQRVAIGIYKALVHADPAHTSAYKANLVRFLKALRAKSSEWLALFKPLAGKPLISYHRSVKYLARYLGLRMLVELEPKPGIPPSPGHVLKVIEVAKANHATVILHETYYPTKTATY